ncbi:MAG: TRAP transporter large permease subunit, partial [Symploca sp. SIO1C4]|nr:TRAP transporter large permease subunit [Symploca sp. SIO1C4]
MTLAYEWLGPAMFAGALVLLSLGYPVAFSLGGVAILFAIFGSILGVFDPILFSAMPLRIFAIMSNYTLLAIPYFIFMGSMLEKSGIAERLLETMGILFGRMRGGLALAVVIVGALLAASTGVVAATVSIIYTGGESYYLELGKDDYYTAQPEPEGIFLGEGAKTLK